MCKRVCKICQPTVSCAAVFELESKPKKSIFSSALDCSEKDPNSAALHHNLVWRVGKWPTQQYQTCEEPSTNRRSSVNRISCCAFCFTLHHTTFIFSQVVCRLLSSCRSTQKVIQQSCFLTTRACLSASCVTVLSATQWNTPFAVSSTAKIVSKWPLLGCGPQLVHIVWLLQDARTSSV